MDIQDAFTQENIDIAGTAMDSDDEAVLRRLLADLFKNNNLDNDQLISDLCVLCFEAGRAYQSDLATMIDVSMSKEMAVDFMHYLVERERT